LVRPVGRSRSGPIEVQPHAVDGAGGAPGVDAREQILHQPGDERRRDRQRQHVGRGHAGILEPPGDPQADRQQRTLPVSGVSAARDSR
jgi:hypothetical protein